MQKSLILIIIGTFIALSLNAVDASETYFKTIINSKEELNKITKIVSIDRVNGLEVYAYANERELNEFQNLGYPYLALAHPGTLIDPEMTTTKDGMRDWDEYPTYQAYLDMMNQFAADYPELCVIENIGNTVQGRELLFAKISDNVNDQEDEPEFVYTSSMHGDETTGYVLTLRLIDYLLSNYGSDPRITNLVDNIEIWINPLANPDGTYHNGDHTVYGATRYNANSVDLNRNFPDPEDGPHPDGNNWQPETIAMMDFADQHSFVMSANFHGGTEVVNYPWDTWPQLAADDEWWQEVCHTYADAAQENSPPGYMDGYDDGITNGYAWYEVNGGRQDYMNYFQFCRESTIELSNTKLLPANQLPALWDYNREALLLYMEECLYGIRGLVTGEDVTRTDPLEATITVIGHDFDNSEAVTDPDVGDYHRPIAPGVYDIEVSSFGYISQVIEGISVADSDIAIFNVILEAAASVTLSGTVIDGDSGLPIENAIVEILDSTFPMAETNDDGSYEIPEVFVADYTIRVFAIGYAGLRQEITVTEDNYIFDFELYESVAESFETGQFPTGWQFDGNANWSIDGTEAYDGFYSAKSGDISHNQFTELSITLDIAEAAEISFYRKTSCEEDPDDDYDYLAFQIDGQEMGRWDGESDWAEVFYPVSTGHRTFSWIYSKDGSVSSGQDCAWIDYIIFPPVGLPAPQNLQAIQEEGAVILNWDLPPDPQGLLGYNIYRDGIQINPETVTETTYIDTDFEFGNTYCYITKAVYSEGESGPSNESCLSPILNSPQNLVAVSFVGTSVMLTWQPPVDDRPGSANQSGQPSVRGSSSERTDRRSDAETGFSPAPASRLTRDLTAYNIYRYQQLIDSVSPDLTTYFDNNLNAGEYCYTVTALYDAGESQPSNEDCAFIESTAIEPGDGTSGRPETIALQQNNPNPFNPRGRSDLTTIAYALPAPASITLKIYDAAGREVKTLIDCHHPAGYFRVSWDGRNRNGRPAASGLYYYQIEVKDSASGMGKRFVEERRMVLLK